LIGSDFLAHFDLAVDLKRMRLVNNKHQFLRLQEPLRRGVFALYGVHPAPPSTAPHLLSTFILSSIILSTFSLNIVTWRFCCFTAGGSRCDKP
jgi:hypothetical protein